MLGRILRASLLRLILGAAVFLKILRSCCVEMIFEGLPCWEGHCRPVVFRKILWGCHIGKDSEVM